MMTASDKGMKNQIANAGWTTDLKNRQVRGWIDSMTRQERRIRKSQTAARAHRRGKDGQRVEESKLLKCTAMAT